MHNLSRDNRLMMLSLLLWGIGDGLIIYVQPLYIRWLGATPFQIGAVLSLANVTLTLAFFPAGRLADKFDRRRLIIPGWILGTLGTLLMAIAPDWRWLIPGLVLYTAGGYNLPVINSYVADAANRKNLPAVFATVFAGYSFGSMLSPLASGYIAGWTSYRVVYFLGVGFFLLSTILIFFLSDQQPHKSGDMPGLNNMLKNRGFLKLLGVYFVGTLIMFVGQPLAPNYAIETYGTTLAQIGLLGTLNSLGSMVIALLIVRIRMGNRWLQALNQVLMGLSFGLLLLHMQFGGLVLAFLLRGSFQAYRSVAGAHISQSLEPQTLGLGFGLYNTITGLAITIAPLIAGWLYSFHPDYSLSIPLALLPVAIGLTLICRQRLAGPLGRGISGEC